MNTTPFALSGIQTMQDLMALPIKVAQANMNLNLALWQAMLAPKASPKPETDPA